MSLDKWLDYLPLVARNNLSPKLNDRGAVQCGTIGCNTNTIKEIVKLNIDLKALQAGSSGSERRRGAFLIWDRNGLWNGLWLHELRYSTEEKEQLDVYLNQSCTQLIDTKLLVFQHRTLNPSSYLLDGRSCRFHLHSAWNVK